jgi:hypothetical protein
MPPPAFANAAREAKQRRHCDSYCNSRRHTLGQGKPRSRTPDRRVFGDVRLNGGTRQGDHLISPGTLGRTGGVT